MRGLIKHILKEETNKFELVKNLIYTMFDNVRFVEYVAERNEVMIYYTNRDNRQMLIPTEICDMITKYTGLDVVPWYDYCHPTFDDEPHSDNQPDFYIDTEEYDESLNEGIRQHPREEEFNRYKDDIDRIIYSVVSKEELCGYGTEFFLNGGEDDVKFINESKYNSQKKLIENILNTIVLPEYEHVICGFEVKEPHERFDTLGNTPFQFISVTIIFIGGIGTKLWPQTQGVQRMYDDVGDEVWDVIYNYTNEAVDVYRKTVKDCGKGNIYLRESKENYSPAGKEIIPNKIVIHKSNPKVRDKILNEGLKVRAGECYKIYAGYGEKCIPAIFATNSTNKRSWFDSTYDDDVWEINTEMIPDVKWYKDKHYESRSKHIVTFENIPVDAITLKHEGTGKDWGLMESIDKSEDNKLKIVKDLIHTLFDEVSFIKIKKYENKPMIIVYFDNDEAGRQGETYFAEQIQRKIYEYTGIKLIPYWHTIQYNTDADFRLDTIKLKNMDLIPQYENERNDINESEENKKEKKFNRLIQNVEDYLNSNEYPSVKRFTVYYEDTHDDVIVNIFFDAEESVKLGGGINSVIKKVGKQVMSDLEVFPLDFKYYIHFDKGINESKETEPKYLSLIKELVEPFKDEEGVCDINVSYDDEDDMYTAYLVIGTEEMNEKFFYVPAMQSHISKLRMNVKNTIKQYIPIYNLYVGSYGKPNCEWDPISK